MPALQLHSVQACARANGVAKKAKAAPTFLDVGCGEGWLLADMCQQGWEVAGIDFSRAGVARWNPDVLPFLVQGNVYDILNVLISDQKRYDMIHLGNVIEHVLDPEKILFQINEILASQGIFIITAPNDFSPLQNYLLANNYADREYFLFYPDHISYFNKESMANFLEASGYRVLEVISDFPIEFNLLAEHTNYIKNKDVGKILHKKRIKIENLLFEQNPNILIDIYRTLGKNGLGRNLIYYCMKQ